MLEPRWEKTVIHHPKRSSEERSVGRPLQCNDEGPGSRHRRQRRGKGGDRCDDVEAND